MYHARLLSPTCGGFTCYAWNVGDQTLASITYVPVARSVNHEKRAQFSRDRRFVRLTQTRSNPDLTTVHCRLPALHS